VPDSIAPGADNRARLEPKFITILREGYGLAQLRADTIAGITVGIVALPLAMALAIASGASPDKGLLTAIVAGFLISLLGGSRVQVGGPTGAFVVVIYGIIATHGYDGLLLASLMAGLILAISAFAGMGQLIRYIPHPVVTGFTAGIAVIIASSQVKDFLGLDLSDVPAEFIPKWQAYLGALGSADGATFAVGAGALALILILKRVAPRIPGFLVAVVASAVIVALLDLKVDTVGSRFPGMAVGIPMPALPIISLAKVQALLPSAFTIAFLAGIEALLSAVVADGMTGYRHRPNQELLGQGIANIASAAFGGLPATGAIARTATNVKAGGRTPVAGMIHALFVLLAAWLAKDLLGLVPMAALAAILFVVAWGMSEIDRFMVLMRMPMGDRVILLLTFGLTVFVDLTVAIAVGVTLASLLFMARMSESVSLHQGAAMLNEDDPDAEDPGQRLGLPRGVEVFQVSGPLFFGVAAELLDSMRRIGQRPKVIILRMRLVPFLDSSGATALAEFVHQGHARGCHLVISGLQPQPRDVLARAGVTPQANHVSFAADYAEARAIAAAIVGISATVAGMH
jgi:sulfate permease, SulP family